MVDRDGPDSENDEVTKIPLTRRLRAELIRSNENGVFEQPLEACDADEFRAACSYLGKDMLNEGVLQSALQSLRKLGAAIKSMYTHGNRCCVTVMPVDELGKPFNEAQKKEAQHLYRLLVGDDGTTVHYSVIVAHYFSLLPVEIQQKCSFVIDYKDLPDYTGQISDTDFMNFYNAYVDAFNELRAFFCLEKLPVENWHLKKGM